MHPQPEQVQCDGLIRMTQLSIVFLFPNLKYYGFHHNIFIFYQSDNFLSVVGVPSGPGQEKQLQAFKEWIPSG